MSGARAAIQLALGAVFLLSTLGKLRRPRAFLRGVADYELLPKKLAVVLATLLIPAEAFVATAHLSGRWIGVAAPLALGMLLVFTVAVAVNLRRERELPCYCFDADGAELISGQTLARLLLLAGGEIFVLSAPGFFAGSWSRPLFESWSTAFADVTATAMWAGLALIAGLWLVHAGQLWELIKQGHCKSCSEPSTRSSEAA